MVLQVVQNPPQDAVIAALEDALEDARNGKLIAVAIAGVGPGNVLAQGWSETGSMAVLLGAVHRLSHVLNTEYDQQAAELAE